MTDRKKLFQGLDPWRPAAVVQEVASHVLLVAGALYFGLGYLGLILIFMAEIVLGNLVSTGMYPERGLRKHLWDLVKILALMAFLLVFVVATYFVATGHGSGTWGNPFASLRFDVDAVKVAVAFAALHLSVLYVVARRQPHPRLAWTKSVSMQNAATLLGLFFMIFVAAFAGPVVAGVAETMGWPNPTDAALIVCVAALRLSLALLLTRMPEREVREIASTPYVD
jgi:hypothetical protein